MKPSIGRIVHYQAYRALPGEHPSACRAAIITEVDDYQANDGDPHIGAVGLAVLNPTGTAITRGVLQDEIGRRGGTWHWPERVE